MAWMTIEQAAEATCQTEESIRDRIATGKLRIETRENRIRVFVKAGSGCMPERPVRSLPENVETDQEDRPKRSVRRTASLIALIAVGVGAVSYFTIIRSGDGPPDRYDAPLKWKGLEGDDAIVPEAIAAAGGGPVGGAVERDDAASTPTGRDLARVDVERPIDVAWTLEPPMGEIGGASDSELFRRVYANRAMAGDPRAADDAP